MNNQKLPPSEGDLYAIVYVSTAARPLSLAELHHLLKRAQARNLKENITGVLLYADGTFMQYLEGPAPGLYKVYEVIKADPQHYGIVDLVREPVGRREFSGWSMAFRVINAAGPSSEAEQDARLEQRLAVPINQFSAARELLAKFWFRGRSVVASTLLDFSEERAKRIAAARQTAAASTGPHRRQKPEAVD
jgi:hypothetical protein